MLMAARNRSGVIKRKQYPRTARFTAPTDFIIKHNLCGKGNESTNHCENETQPI